MGGLRLRGWGGRLGFSPGRGGRLFRWPGCGLGWLGLVGRLGRPGGGGGLRPSGRLGAGRGLLAGAGRCWGWGRGLGDGPFRGRARWGGSPVEWELISTKPSSSHTPLAGGLGFAMASRLLSF
ncbi:hypothetical protein D5272_05000 [bacterium D16-76]|nr:hypothetical protein [bacterium D16-76]